MPVPLLNTENQLGVVFYVSVSDDKIPEQIHPIMTEMAKHFPKNSVTVVAYGASSLPYLVGIARIDGTTGEMTFTP